VSAAFGLLRRQAAFLRLLALHPSLTRAEYQAIAGISYNTARADLADLSARGLIARVGASSATRYALTKAVPLAPGADRSLDQSLIGC
jgi:predicted HTH transcriptional regulator